MSQLNRIFLPLKKRQKPNIPAETLKVMFTRVSQPLNDPKPRTVLVALVINWKKNLNVKTLGSGVGWGGQDHNLVKARLTA